MMQNCWSAKVFHIGRLLSKSDKELFCFVVTDVMCTALKQDGAISVPKTNMRCCLLDKW